MSANLVHKVGVLFHAQDRLSRHMEQIAHKFTGLEKHQKLFEKGMRDIERMDSRVAKLHEQNATKMANADIRNMRSAKALGMAKLSIINAEMQAQQRLAAFQRQQASVAASTEAKLKAIDDARMARQTKLHALMAGKIAAENKAFGTRTAAIDNALAGLGRQRSAILRAGGSILTPGEQRQHSGRINRSRAQIRVLEAERNATMIAAAQQALPGHVHPSIVPGPHGQVNMHAAGVTEAELERARHLARIAADSETRSIRALETLIAKDEQRLAQHVKLTTIDAERDRLDVQRTQAVHRNQQEVEALGERQKMLLQQIQAQHEADAAIVRAAQDRELAKNTELFEEKTAHYNALLAQKQHMYEQDLAIEKELQVNLKREADLRAENIRLAEAQATADRADLLIQERKAAVEARRAAIGKGAGMFASGMGTVATAGVAAAVLGGGAYYLAHKSADVDKQITELRMSLQSRPGLANKLINGMNARDTMFDQGIMMSAHQQLDIMRDMIASGINPEHVEGNMKAFVPLLRLTQLRGGKTENLVKDMSFVFERANLQTPEDIDKFAQRFAQGMAVSGRLTPKFAKDFMTKFSPVARQLKLNLTDIPTMEFAASAFPSGSQASTDFAGLFGMLAKGGSNDTSRTIFKAMVQSGLLKYAAKPDVIRDTHGKVVLGPNGKPKMLAGTFNYDGESGISALRLVVEKIGELAHVSKADMASGKMTAAQSARMTQVLATAFPNQKGGKLAAMFQDPAMMKRIETEQGLVKGAPNLTQQINQFGGQMGFKTQNLVAQMQELGRVMGKQLQPHVQSMINSLTLAAIATRHFIQHHPRMIQGIIGLTKAIVVGMGVFGAATMAVGATKVAVGLWKWALVDGTVATIKATTALKNFTTLYSLFGPSLGTVFVSAIKKIPILAVAGALGTLIGGAIAMLTGHDPTRLSGKPTLDEDAIRKHPGKPAPYRHLRPPTTTTGRALEFNAETANLTVAYTEKINPAPSGGTHKVVVEHRHTVEFKGHAPPGMDANKLMSEMAKKTGSALPAVGPNSRSMNGMIPANFARQ